MTSWSRREFLVNGASIASAAGLPLVRSPERKIRAAVLGIGHAHAAGKASVLRASSDYQLVGICEPDEDLRRQFGTHASYKNIRWLALNEILEDSSIDLIVIESRVRENLTYGRMAIQAGKHIHLDKPPGDNLAEFSSLLEEAEGRRMTVQMGYMWRFNRGIQLAGEAIRNGWLGEVYLLRGVVNSEIPPGDPRGPDLLTTRSSLSLFSGGMMFELGCHLIERMVDFLGRPTKVTPFLRHDGKYQDNLADNALAVFEFDRALAEIYSTAQQPFGGKYRVFEAQGTNGTIRVSPIEPPFVEIDLKLSAGPYASGRQKFQVQNEPRYIADFREMAQVIRKQKLPSFSAKHDNLTQETLLRACGAI